MELDMVCPECGKNEWELKYEGDEITETSKVTTYIGSYGHVRIICKKCKYRHYIYVGSD